MFALAALPLIGMAGLAIDFGFAAEARSQMALAADNAALQAVTTTANAFKADQSNYISQGELAAQQWFAVQAGTAPQATVTLPVTVAMTQNGGTFLATVTYNFYTTTFFGQLFGVKRIYETGVSQATITTNAYVNVTFLLDNSSSMLIASTEAGIAALEPLTNAYKGTYPPTLMGSPPAAPSSTEGAPPLQPCAFACHWTANQGTANDGLVGYTDDFYGIARKNGIQLRFDVLESATAAAIGVMEARELIPNQFGVGVFTFNSTLNQIYPVSTSSISSTDLADAITAAKGMSTPVTDDAANTNFSGSTGAMAKLTALLPSGGNGSTQATAQQALIIVTDGMQDWNPVAGDGNRTLVGSAWPYQQGPMNPTTTGYGSNAAVSPQDCSAAKAKGITVYVLYTTYQNDPTVLLYGNIAMAPYLAGTSSPSMVASLTACASAAADFIQASDAASITAGVTTLLQSALQSSGRFTE